MESVDDVTSFARGLDSLSTKFFSTINSERNEMQAIVNNGESHLER